MNSILNIKPITRAHSLLLFHSILLCCLALISHQAVVFGQISQQDVGQVKGLPNTPAAASITPTTIINNSASGTSNLTASILPSTTATVLTNALTSAINNASEISDEVKKWNEFKNSIYYLPPFESEVITAPKEQVDFIRTMTTKDLELFRAILREAIDKKNNFAPAMSLMLKYSAKLLGNFIKNRRDEMKIKPRVEPKKEFWEMLAKLAEKIIEKSALVKKEKGYNKKNVDTVEMYKRVDAAFKYYERIVSASPVAAYLKWDQMVLFKNESIGSDRALCEEAADLAAQFRGMGYESCIFVAKRVVNLLRMFARGFIPSLKDV